MLPFALYATRSESESTVDNTNTPRVHLDTPALSAYTSAYTSAMSTTEAAGEAVLSASHSATVSTPAAYEVPEPPRALKTLDSDGWIPNHALTEKILRVKFAVPPQRSVDLAILPATDDPDVKGWPEVHDILQIAIFGAPGHQATPGRIFEALKARFRYYRELAKAEELAWKVCTSLRLILSGTVKSDYLHRHVMLMVDSDGRTCPAARKSGVYSVG